MVQSAGPGMSKVKTEQRRLTLRGRSFHFVSYEAEPANPARDKPGVIAALPGAGWLGLCFVMLLSALAGRQRAHIPVSWTEVGCIQQMCRYE